MEHIIIDCDPGHDDALAIFCALANPDKLNILGFTSVCGNQIVEKVHRNLAGILNLVNCTIPYAKGAAQPLLVAPDPQPIAHGESGLDGPIIPLASKYEVEEHAVDFMYQQINQASDKVTIVALAPLTNIALLLSIYPEIKNKIKQICLMGGAITKGNINQEAEFNIYADPHAAKIVFASGIKIIMAPLEACEDCSIKLVDIELFNRESELAKFTYEALMFYSNYSRVRNIDHSPIFDLAPMMYLLHPEFFQTSYHQVEIILTGEQTRGKTKLDLSKHDSKILHQIILSGDNQKIMQSFIADFNKLELMLK